MILKTFIKQFDDYSIAKIKLNLNLLNTNKSNSNPLNSNKSNPNLLNINKLNGPLDSSIKNKIIKILANLEYININFKNFISHQKTSAETFTYKPNTTDIFFETQNINNNIIKNENIATISKFQNLRDLKTACKNIIKTYNNIYNGKRHYLDFKNIYKTVR